MNQPTQGNCEHFAMSLDKTAGDGQGRHRLDGVAARLLIQATGADISDTAGPVTSEQMRALRAGRLSRSERERLLALFDADREAFADWLAFSAALDQDNEVRRSSCARRVLLAGIGTAAAVALAVVVWLVAVPPGPPVAAQVAEAFQAAERLGILPDAALSVGSDRSEVRFGFHAPAPSGAERALMEGVREGYGRVSGDADRRSSQERLPDGAGGEARPEEARVERDLAPYAAFGQWLVLLEALCGSAPTIPAALWVDQEALAAGFGAAFETQAEEEPLAVLLGRQLPGIQDSLRHLSAEPTEPASARACAGLVRQVAVTLDRARGVDGP